MRRTALGVAIVVVLGVPWGCQERSRAPTTRPRQADQMETFTGTLEGGVMAIGGETTGWRLVGDGESGGIEVDVSDVRAQAEMLDGKRVTVSGRMTQRDYVERGQVRVLVADRIRASAP
jgi:hypothetical protein